jgi:hypothetical protein
MVNEGVKALSMDPIQGHLPDLPAGGTDTY